MGRIPLLMLLLLALLLVAALSLLGARRHRRTVPASGQPDSGVPTGSGRIAYEITVGVVGLLLGGMFTVVGVWWIVVAATASSVLFFSSTGAAGGGAVAGLVIGLIIGGAGIAIVVRSRARLLRL